MFPYILYFTLAVLKQNMLILSPAKINLYLEILQRNPDGFHSIKTIFQTISLYDEIVLAPLSKKEFRIVSIDPKVPRGEENFIVKALNILTETFNINKGLEIRLNKNIPIGAGLGGGSSNVASVIKGVNSLWKLNLSQEELMKIARNVSSDAAFFIKGGTALGVARGDNISLLPSLKRKWILLILPSFSINTKNAYKIYDKYCCSESFRENFRLTNTENISKIEMLLREENWDKLLYNSFEKPIFEEYSILKDIKSSLNKSGFKHNLLSGSGSVMFVVLNSKSDHRKIEHVLKKFPVKTELVQTI